MTYDTDRRLYERIAELERALGAEEIEARIRIADKTTDLLKRATKGHARDHCHCPEHFPVEECPLCSPDAMKAEQE